jgi:uncharacterized protein (TIGR01777 family)
LNILVTGSTGLIGSELYSFLTNKKHRILRMVRRGTPKPDEILWNPSSGALGSSSLEGLDAVVHLAGESIASKRWTAKKMRRIRESRIKGTNLLAQSLAHLSDPPKVLVSVSAVGFYGNRGEEQLNEESGAGEGFLAQVCREWESATAPASERGIRVVIPRVGMILSARGGVLSQMLPIYRLGIGGTIGSGRQYMSWIAIDDMVGVINHVIQHDSVRGPVNAVSPNPVTNSTFSKTLGRVLSRPTMFALPAFAVQLALGKMADELLLSSSRVSPVRLVESGFRFAFPKLEEALRYILHRPAAELR